MYYKFHFFWETLLEVDGSSCAYQVGQYRSLICQMVVQLSIQMKPDVDLLYRYSMTQEDIRSSAYINAQEGKVTMVAIWLSTHGELDGQIHAIEVVKYVIQFF